VIARSAVNSANFDQVVATPQEVWCSRDWSVAVTAEPGGRARVDMCAAIFR
jgi:hypothetical protein